MGDVPAVTEHLSDVPLLIMILSAIRDVQSPLV